MTLVLAVLVASLLGSVHCAAMCGAFVCFYSASGAAGPSSWRENLATHSAYNVGRLCSYLLLGSVAGGLGRSITAAGDIAGVQRAGAIIAGMLMVTWGGYSVLSARGILVHAAEAPEAWRRAMGSVLVRLRGQPSVTRAAATGLATTLLPCGWLYAFVVTASAAGSVRGGATVMLVFWLGTLPMMITVGFGARRFMGRFGAQMPIVSGAAIMVLGLLSIVGRISVAGMPLMPGMRMP